jgi:hypothetical protein
MRERMRRKRRGLRGFKNAERRGCLDRSKQNKNSNNPISRSSSQIFNPALGNNRQMVMLEDRAMLRNKNSRVTDSISTRLGLMGKKSRVIAWNFMGKMYMYASACLFTKHCTVLKRK